MVEDNGGCRGEEEVNPVDLWGEGGGRDLDINVDLEIGVVRDEGDFGLEEFERVDGEVRCGFDLARGDEGGVLEKTEADEACPAI